MGHTEWLPGVQLEHSAPPAQHIKKIGRASAWLLSACSLVVRALAAEAGAL